jgi:hypothetical protein
VSDEEPNRRDAYKDIHGPQDLRQGSKQHAKHVPITTDKTAKADETPVKAADNKQDKRYHVEYFHIVFVREKMMAGGSTYPRYYKYELFAFF